MTSINEIRSEVGVWPDQVVSALALKLINTMINDQIRQYSKITFQDMCHMMGRDTVDESVVATITMLVTSDVNVLDAAGVFIDETEKEWELSNKDISDAERYHSFFHPRTGVKVEDFESRIFPIFRASERFMNAIEAD